MFERFTERARQAIVLAQDEARRLMHDHIGTEHILLGLLLEEEGLAARVLGSLGLTVDGVREHVIRIVEAGDEVATGQIPYTPRAKKVLQLALREALSLGHNYVGTEHVLLGLVREDEGVAARILLDFDADAERIRSDVISLLEGVRALGARSTLVYFPEQGREASEGWLRCGSCNKGIAVAAAGQRCLGCMSAEQRREALTAARGQFDLRGVEITAALMAEILEHAGVRADHLVLGDARFDEAVLADGISFERVVFAGSASFARARFGRNASFEGALFESSYGDVSFAGATLGGQASFAHAVFEAGLSFADATFGPGSTLSSAFFGRESSFDRARFADRTTFAAARFGSWPSFRDVEFGAAVGFTGAVFGRGARFIGARFGDWTSFAGADFGDGCRFDESSFGDHASFERATFREGASFAGTVFGASARFGGAAFDGDVSFTGTTFGGDARLGPLLATGACSLERAVFSRGPEIQVAAERVVCSGIKALEGASLRIRYADVLLAGAHFDGPSTVAGDPDPFDRLPEERLREAAGEQARTERPGRPRVLSLSGSDVQHLVLAHLDLRQCRFTGTHNLDQLLLEGVVDFAGSPRRVRWGRTIFPIWWWTRRITLAEEQDWRAATAKRSGWTRIPQLAANGKRSLDAPVVERTIDILRERSDEYRARHRVEITDDALEAAATLVARHLGERELPERAVDLIAATVARYSTQNPVPSLAGLAELNDQIEAVRQLKEAAIEAQEFETAVGHRDRERRLIQERAARMWQPLGADRQYSKVVELQEQIEEMRTKKERAIDAQEFEAAAGYRLQERELNKELTLAREPLEDEHVVGRNKVAETLSTWTGIPTPELADASVLERDAGVTNAGGGQASRRELASGRRARAAEIATVYRALRKGREDFKDAPGAADFYYGEMEMRRNAAAPFSVERLLLWLYWLVSGYGLRASRAFACLIATVALFAVLFQEWGFAQDETFADALAFSGQSTIGLFRSAPERPLTTTGQWLQIGLRLLGPLFLGLALLSLRGRVKR